MMFPLKTDDLGRLASNTLIDGRLAAHFWRFVQYQEAYGMGLGFEWPTIFST